MYISGALETERQDVLRYVDAFAIALFHNVATTGSNGTMLVMANVEILAPMSSPTRLGGSNGSGM